MFRCYYVVFILFVSLISCGDFSERERNRFVSNETAQAHAPDEEPQSSMPQTHQSLSLLFEGDVEDVLDDGDEIFVVVRRGAFKELRTIDWIGERVSDVAQLGQPSRVRMATNGTRSWVLTQHRDPKRTVVQEIVHGELMDIETILGVELGSACAENDSLFVLGTYDQTSPFGDGNETGGLFVSRLDDRGPISRTVPTSISTEVTDSICHAGPVFGVRVTSHGLFDLGYGEEFASENQPLTALVGWSESLKNRYGFNTSVFGVQRLDAFGADPETEEIYFAGKVNVTDHMDEEKSGVFVGRIEDGALEGFASVEGDREGTSFVQGVLVSSGKPKLFGYSNEGLRGGGSQSAPFFEFENFPNFSEPKFSSHRSIVSGRTLLSVGDGVISIRRY